MLTPRLQRAATPSFAELDVFAGCGRRELDGVARLMTQVAVPAGRILTREDEPGREFFIVVDGYADVCRDSEVIATLGPGSFFGEMALLDRGVRTATVRAGTAMELYVLTDGEFRQLLAASPTVVRNMLRTMSQRLRGASPVRPTVTRRSVA